MIDQPKAPSGVLERALSLMACFTQGHPRLSLRELAAMTGLDKATALRALRTLVEWGYLERGPDGAYSAGPANLRMAALFKATTNFISRLEVPIAEISKQVHQTTSFFVRSNAERVCLVRDHAYKDFRYFIEVGGSVPLAEGGAAAQILLAYSEPDSEAYARIRARGHYLSRGERNKHFAAVAVPLFESDGSFLGAVAITGMGVDLSDEMLLDFTKTITRHVEAAGFGVTTSGR